jgi:hypothetical protein
MELVNNTPFVTGRFAMHDRSGRDVLVVLVKCTYSFRGGRSLAVAEEAAPIQMADEFWGEPGESSVRYESDLAPRKTGTDVVMIGHAYALKGKATKVDVSLQVGALRKTVRVFGDRCWKKTLMGFQPSSPSPFDRLPLVYERAYGGRDLTGPEPEQDDRNPLGQGFIARKSLRNLEELVLPNIEDPTHLISHPADRPEPAGFGFIARYWQPRRALAGTCDDNWKEKRAPLLPSDFSEDYHNGASADLIAKPYLLGNEPVEIRNASESSLLRFSLPGTRPGVRLFMGENPSSLDLVFDTLLIEPDLERIAMVWRGVQDVHNRLEEVKRIEVSNLL